MNRMIRLCLLTFGAAGLLATGNGCVYANVKAPLDTNLDETRLGDRRGESHAHSVLGLVAWGDAGTRAAAEEGGITTIRHADQRFIAVLGLVYTRVTTIVYGD